MKREHERRLRKLETVGGADEPKGMFCGIPISDQEATRIWDSWREEVAAGRAKLSHGIGGWCVRALR